MLRNIQDEILRLKKEKNVVILAHSYQSPEILEVADHTGDSFKLSVVAKDLPQSKVIMCGVHFMAQTVKILSPEKTVYMPVESATCPMAEQILPQRVVEFKRENPSFTVVAYINTTAELKAVSDVCVTSSSAVKIVKAIEGKDILFIPDKNLGNFVKEQLPEKNIVLWEGYCPVHNAVTVEDCEKIKAKYPNATVLMHPELPKEVLAYGDVIGSTADILNYAKSHDEECIIGTEKSISDFLKMNNSNFEYPILSKKLICADMRVTTIADLYNTLTGKSGVEIVVDEELRRLAKKPIDEMIRLG